MSNNSEAVKRNRENRKDLMISAFGGKCCICGYNKSNRALHFHHINPDEKSFSISKMRANPISWDKIVIELKKCVLLCSNCHCEVHDNLIKLSDNVTM